MKSGIRSTEFFLSLLASAAGIVVQFFPGTSPAAKIAGLVVTVLATLGYTASRTTLKTNGQSGTPS